LRFLSLLSEALYNQASSLCTGQQVAEFEVPRAKAEKILVENSGDVKKALSVLVFGAQS
jgi:hypothetical protein